MAAFYEEPKVLDTLVSFDNDRSTGNLLIKRTQEIPSSWLAGLREIKEGNRLAHCGDWLPVASIPVEVADDLKRRGYDVTVEPYKKTIALLKRLSLDHFILTEKRF